MSAHVNWGALVASVLRETRAARGRLIFFTLCLALGVAAVVGVSSLVFAVRGGMAAESKDLLAADLRVEARRPLPRLEGLGSRRQGPILPPAVRASTFPAGDPDRKVGRVESVVVGL